MDKEYLKLSEAAGMLGMAPKTLRRHLNELQEKHGLERGRLIVDGQEIARRLGQKGWWNVSPDYVSREKDLPKQGQTGTN